jgi:cell division protein FtsQ
MKRSRKFIVGFALLLIAAVGVVALANLWKSKLVIEHVLVSGNLIVESDDILKLAHVPVGSRMVDLDLLLVESRVAAHPYVDKVVVQRNLPSTIHIEILERQPLALLNGDELCYVDREGVILPNPVSRELFDLPVITGLPSTGSRKPGTIIMNADLAEALDILETSKQVGQELYHLISEIRIRNGGDIVLYTADGGVPVIYGKGDTPRKLVSFETFWRTIVAERGPQDLQYVDLRFENQIVARWKHKS